MELQEDLSDSLVSWIGLQLPFILDFTVTLIPFILDLTVTLICVCLDLTVTLIAFILEWTMTYDSDSFSSRYCMSVTLLG